jgi:hypothetical protein
VFVNNDKEYIVHCSLRPLKNGEKVWLGYIINNGVMFAMLGDQFKSIEEIYAKAKIEIEKR